MTGASRGIGRATAWSLAQRGFDLVIVSRTASDLEALATDLQRGCRVSVTPVAADLRRRDDLARLVAIVFASGSALDVLVNNAAVRGRAVPFTEYALEEMDDLLDLNLRAPALLCREAGRLMSRQGDGHIINVLSSACLHSYETFAVYTAVKCGLQALTRVLAKELRHKGVRVTALIPGGTDSRTPPDQDTPYLRPAEVGELIADIAASRRAVLQEVVVRTLGDERI